MPRAGSTHIISGTKAGFWMIRSSGHAAGPDDLLAVVDVVHEGVERAHALLDAGGEAAPFGRAQDARDDVEGDEALGGRVVAVDGEGDAGAAEQRLGVLALALEVVDLLRLQPLVHGQVGLAHPSPPVRFISSNAAVNKPLTLTGRARFGQTPAQRIRTALSIDYCRARETLPSARQIARQPACRRGSAGPCGCVCKASSTAITQM